MPALNFQRRFADDVELGIKRQSARAHRVDGRAHCKVGDVLKLYTGMRTKQCRLLGEADVISVSSIEIFGTEMKIDGHLLHATLHSRDDEQTDNEFAKADGFESFMDMADWFQNTHGLPFKGVVIRWSEPR